MFLQPFAPTVELVRLLVRVHVLHGQDLILHLPPIPQYLRTKPQATQLGDVLLLMGNDPHKLFAAENYSKIN